MVFFYRRFLPLDVYKYVAKRHESVRKRLITVFPRVWPSRSEKLRLRDPIEKTISNSIAQNLIFSIVCWWVFGVMVVALMVVFSTLAKSNTGVLCGTGSVVFASYMLGMLPKCSKYMPSYLTDGNSLIYGLADTEKYMPSLIIAAGLSVICLVISIPIFNKRHL